MGKRPAPPERIAFAKRLRDARERKHEYASGMADAMGIERERYRMWERGDREPDIVHFIKIAKELNVSLDYLIIGRLPSLVPTEPDRPKKLIERLLRTH